jgi:myosin heavy subunit
MSGFENFQVNSFEQLCINVANEHLQYYFNEHIFLQEEQDYRTEGVSCEKIVFQNNEDLIELFMGVNIISRNILFLDDLFFSFSIDIRNICIT